MGNSGAAVLAASRRVLLLLLGSAACVLLWLVLSASASHADGTLPASPTPTSVVAPAVDPLVTGSADPITPAAEELGGLAQQPAPDLAEPVRRAASDAVERAQRTAREVRTEVDALAAESARTVDQTVDRAVRPIAEQVRHPDGPVAEDPQAVTEAAPVRKPGSWPSETTPSRESSAQQGETLLRVGSRVMATERVSMLSAVSAQDPAGDSPDTRLVEPAERSAPAQGPDVTPCSTVTSSASGSGTPSQALWSLATQRADVLAGVSTSTTSAHREPSLRSDSAPGCTPD